MSRLAPLKIKIGRYGTFLRHMAADGLWRYRGRTIAAWLTAAAALGLQVIAITLAIYVARGFQNDATFDRFGLQFPFRSMTALAACAAIALVLLLIAGWAQFISRELPLLMWREYAEFCSRRVIGLLRQDSPAPVLGSTLKEDAQLMSHVRTEASLCGRVLSLLVAVFVPIGVLAAACAVLLYLEFWLTLILIAMAAVAGVFIFRINVRATAHAIEMDAQMSDAAAEYRRLLQRHKWLGSSAADVNDDLEVAFRSGAPGRHLRSYIGRLQMINLSDLAGGLLMAAAVCLILVMLGGSILREGVGWERLAIYLVALRYATTNFRGVINRFTAINLFYAQVRRYFEFVEAASRPRTPVEPQTEYTLAAPRVEFDGSLQELKVEPGARLALFTPIEINRYTIAYMLGILLGHETTRWRAAIGSVAFIPSCGDEQQDGVNSRSSDSGLPGELTAAQWLFIEAAKLGCNDSKQCGAILDQTGDQIVMIVRSDNFERVGEHGESAVIISNKGRIVGMGSPEWFASHRDEVAEMIRSLRPAASGPGGSREDDIIDIDMDE